MKEKFSLEEVAQHKDAMEDRQRGLHTLEGHAKFIADHSNDSVETDSFPTAADQTTQRKIEIELDAKSAAKWRMIGKTKGLSSDTEIANFLIQQYEAAHATVALLTCCIQCSTPLTILCEKCQPAVKQENELEASSIRPRSLTVDKNTDGGAIFSLHPPSVQSDSRDVKSEQVTIEPTDKGEVTELTEQEQSLHTGHPSSGTLMYFPDGDLGVKTVSQHSVVSTFTGKTEKRVFRCKECDTEYRNPKALKKHKLKHHPTASRRQNLSADVNKHESMETTDYSHTEKWKKPLIVEQCKVCGKEVKKVRMKTHMVIHSDEKPFLCTECGASFKRNQQLKSHMETHTGIFTRKCGECGAFFPTKTLLFKHRRDVHSQPQVCQVCGAFVKKYLWKSHMRKHSDVKPFSCVHCGMTFKYKQSFVDHMNIHAGVQPYVCAECGASFTRPSSFYVHRSRVHSNLKPFKCTLCADAFKKSVDLKKHMHMHKGDKPLKCDECGSIFFHDYALKRHMMVHTGEKPFPCSKCDRAFPTKCDLKAHSDRRHNKAENQSTP